MTELVVMSYALCLAPNDRRPTTDDRRHYRRPTTNGQRRSVWNFGTVKQFVSKTWGRASGVGRRVFGCWRGAAEERVQKREERVGDVFRS